MGLGLSFHGGGRKGIPISPAKSRERRTQRSWEDFPELRRPRKGKKGDTMDTLNVFGKVLLKEEPAFRENKTYCFFPRSRRKNARNSAPQ